MKKHLKGLGIALVAVLSMSVSASAAQAESFKSASYPVTVSGSQTTELEFAVGTTRRWHCSTASFTSPSLSDQASALSLSPYFNGCSIKIPNSLYVLDATVSPGDCTITLLEPAGKQGKANIACPAGQSIIVNVYNGANVAHIEANRICQYSIVAQTAQGSIQYANSSGNLSATSSLVGISIKRLAGTTTNCGAVEQSLSVTGDVLLKGNGGATAIEVG